MQSLRRRYLSSYVPGISFRKCIPAARPWTFMLKKKTSHLQGDNLFHFLPAPWVWVVEVVFHVWRCPTYVMSSVLAEAPSSDAWERRVFAQYMSLPRLDQALVYALLVLHQFKFWICCQDLEFCVTIQIWAFCGTMAIFDCSRLHVSSLPWDGACVLNFATVTVPGCIATHLPHPTSCLTCWFCWLLLLVPEFETNDLEGTSKRMFYLWMADMSGRWIQLSPWSPE